MYWPGKIDPSGLGTSARTRNVEVCDVDLVVDEDGLADVRMRPLALDDHVDCNPLLYCSAVAIGQERAAGRRSSPIGSSCWMVTSSVGAGVADQVADLDLELADPAVDRGVHPAITQVELGIIDGGLGPGDLGLGAGDVDLIVGLRLFEAGLIGFDLGRALLALGLGLVVIVLGGGLAGQQVPLARSSISSRRNWA